MRDKHKKYICYPSVVCVGKETEITIFPRDISRRFLDDYEYKIGAFGLRDTLLDYHQEPEYTIDSKVADGCIKFTYTFEKEQEYSVRFKDKSGNRVKIPVYAVNSDLYELRPLKGDLHTHSYYSDAQDGTAMVPANYREEGFDFFALTDHNRMFPSSFLPKLYENVPLGIEMLEGEEIHTPGSPLHIVHIGGSYSVCEKYIKNPEQFKAEVEEIEKTIPNVKEELRYVLASAMWACREIKKAGGISIFAHPFWKCNLYNVSAEFCDLLFDAKIFDVFELFNGSNTQRDNLQLSLWLEQIQKGNNIPIVASSDSHNHDYLKSGFARSFTVVFAKENTQKAIMEAIKNSMSVAAEISIESIEDIRFFSSQFRLVAFAKFLWDNYFDETYNLCVGEGILMRRYAQGENVENILSALADTTNNFYNQFYGKAAAPKLPERCIKYLNDLRTAQRESGLITKGSKLYICGNNYNRE